ncbi:MAG: hypothetical protein GWM87_13165, partial [Xanthomonadales bacterium]|nr:hypothetical protein [Xanthomonadales bacterium]NIX13775.1 hypothetical protein [Xanthomonadales bacterium]
IADSGPKGLSEHWNEHVDPHVAHYEHYFVALDMENSHWNEGAGESATLFGVTEWYIAPGKGADFNAMKEKMSTMAKEKGWANEERNWLWSERIGGKPVASIVSPYENYSDMAPPEVTFYEFAVEQLGEEEADKMFETFSKSASASKYTLWRHIPELSMSDEDE